MLAKALTDISSPEDAAVSITIPAGSFTDVDGNPLSYTATLADGTALPTWLAFNGTRFTGTPPANFNGVLEIEVKASDGTLSTSDVFSLTITPKNDAPVLAVPLPDVAFAEDTAVSIAIPAGTFTDVDSDALTYKATLSNGAALPSWLVFDGTQFAGTPPANFTGAIDIKVTATDGALAASDVFRLTITAVNDAPVLAKTLPDISSPEDAAVSITIPAGSFTDVDGNPLSYTATLADGTALPTWLAFNGTRFTGTPPANFNGVLEIEVKASDGTLSTSDVFSLTITPKNDAPVAVNDGPLSVIDGVVLVIKLDSLLANDSDLDGDALTVISIGSPSNGTAIIDAQGISYTPDFGYEGSDRISYVISDGEAMVTASVQLAVSRPFEGWSQGTTGVDLLVGGDGAPNSIFGDNSNDTITGGNGADRLAGGAGNDALRGNDGDDEFWGMAGNDTIDGGNGTDTAYFNGVRSSYAIVTSAGTIKVTDNQSGVNGNDGVDTLLSMEKLVFRHGEALALAAPIILDLDGSGVETTTAAESSALFDIDNNGVADDTSWVGATEGFLFLDRDRNGTVSGIAELSFIDDVDGAHSDLEGLRNFDSNADGILSVDDVRFEDFRVWQDLNDDGITQKAEILSLLDANVRSINLAASATEATWQFGSTAIVNRGLYTRTDGTKMEYLDAALTHASASPPQAPTLPDSMSGEPTSMLKSALETLASGLDDPIGSWPGQVTPSRTLSDLQGSTATEDWTAGFQPVIWPAPNVDDVSAHSALGGSESNAARLLALMRQDMSAFGSKVGNADLTWRKDEIAQPMDFFA